MKQILFLGDSLAFFTEDGPRLPNNPGLIANRVAFHLNQNSEESWHAYTDARSGRTIAGLPHRLKTDSILIGKVKRSDAVVVSLGSLDATVVTTPRAVRRWAAASLPPSTSALLRRAIRVIRPALTVLSLSRLSVTSSHEYSESWLESVHILRELAPRSPLCALGPTIPMGDQKIFQFSFKIHAKLVRALREVSRRERLAVVDVAALVGPFVGTVISGDQIHWNFALHDRIAKATADALLRELSWDQTRSGEEEFSVGQNDIRGRFPCE